MLKPKSLAAAVLWLGLIFFWLPGAVLVQASPAPVTAPTPRVAAFGKLPLSFVENQGQLDSPFSFYTLGPGLQAGFSPDAITLAFPTGKPGAASAPQPRQVVRLRPVNLSPLVSLTGADPLPGKFNHYQGRDPARWRTGLPIYGSVLYRQAYPEVDLRFYGQGQALEYDIVVQPGGNPSQVRFRLEGVKGLALTPAGDLAVSLPGGRRFLQQKPLIYQEEDGRRVAREGQFKLFPKGPAWEYGFEVAAYDPTRPLIIDPVLVYSTYWGGSGSDTAEDIVTDATGFAFVVGHTSSGNFLTYPGSTFKGGTDVFVLKLNPTGKAMIFATLLGGSANDYGYGLDLDQNGNPCICGQTFSDNFPLQGDPWQETHKGVGDAFVARLSGVNGALLYSTYLGGKYEDKATDLKVDRLLGNIYVVGSTKSNDLFASPFMTYKGGWDAFVARFDAGGGLTWSTYLGGKSDDNGKALALDKLGYVYVTGDTSSNDFYTLKSIHPYRGNGDAFVTKFYVGPTVSSVQFSTYLGGANSDYGVDIVVESYYRDEELRQNIYVTGQTNSQDFPQKDSVHPLQGSYDVFLTRMYLEDYPPYNLYIPFSTLLGGTKLDYGNALALDSRGRVYLTGTTYSNNFYLKKPWYRYGGGELQGTSDAFVAKFSYGGLEYSTYLGGSGNDSGLGIALDSANNLFLTGTTTSGNFPTRNPLTTYWAGGDLFVTKVGVEIPPTAPYFMLLLLTQ